MDQTKVGKFIAKLRKDKDLTQKKLGDELGIIDKTVSKWETGNGMPDTSLLKPLSDLLGITVNELLCGERIENEDIKTKSEEVIVNTLKYTDKEIKQNRISMYIIVFGVFLFVIPLMFFASDGIKAWWTLIALGIISFGIYKIKKSHKILLGILFFILAVGVLLCMDYVNVRYNSKPPIFSLVIITGDENIIYKTPFYNVYRCNVDTINEYYEIDFTRNKEPGNNPFDPSKSDISRLLRYKNKYLGHNSNMSNLINNLPMGAYRFNLELDSEKLGIKINYINSEAFINEDSKDEFFVKRSIIYNSITSFILIDNLEYISFNFSETSYTINKSTTIKEYQNYDRLIISSKIDVMNFKEYVDSKMKDNDFVNDTFSKIIVNE